MPFYEYECSSCKFYTEVMQKISDAPLTKCPSCGRQALKKLLSAPVFRLKGGGWYETDFKSDQEGKRNLALAEKEEASPKEDTAKGSKEATAEPGKADAQPTAAKTDAKPATATAAESRGASADAGGSSERSRGRPAARKAAGRLERRSRGDARAGRPPPRVPVAAKGRTAAARRARPAPSRKK